jgi:UDP-GlcNAc:undecaprenyl-phosphate/decaprenyl-phosphate GlcNAc-1-phosphate transferase
MIPPGLIVFGATLAAALVMTPLVRRLATVLGVVDRPDASRKFHAAPVPLLGGLAVIAALAVGAFVAHRLGVLPGVHIKEKYLIGILLASALLAIGGALDDRFNLRASRQIVWPALAALVIIGSGIGISYVTNPLGGILHLDRFVQTVLWWDGIPYKITLLADIFTFVWLLGMTYTTKLLDGVDGLVSGIAVIGALTIAAVSVTRDVAQPDTAILALVIAGAFAGFLVFNYHPARIFLGEGGSTLAGFLLGTLAIVSGGKIATALLVLGLPLFDAMFVIFGRLFDRKPLAAADRTHLHLRLRDLGFTDRQVVLFYWFVSALFGVSTFVLQGWEKVAALMLLASVLMAATAGSIGLANQRGTERSKSSTGDKPNGGGV